MKLLIVDDNKYVVEGVSRRLDWNAYGIDELFGCYNVSDAKRLLSEHAIDFVISDIEMPGQDGFALLEWIRQRDSEIEVMLLTSYPDFRYAQKAVGYKVSKYLLKPLDTGELETAVREIVQQHQIREKKKQLMEYGSQWISQQSNAKATFWNNLLRELAPDGGEDLDTESPDAGVPYQSKEKLTTVLIFLNTGAEVWQDEMLRFLCDNTLGELSERKRQNFESIYCVQTGQLLAVFRAGESEVPELEQLMREFAEFIKSYFLFDIRYHILEPCTVNQLKGTVGAIIQISGNTVNQEASRFIELQEHTQVKPDYQPPDTQVWKRMLQEGDIIRFQNALTEYFSAHRRSGGSLSTDFLGALLVDWNLLISELLRENTVDQSISKLRENQFGRWLTQDAGELEQLMLEEANRLSQQIHVGNTQTLVAKMKVYIREHIDEVSRGQLAEYFYLSPSYLSKLFHRETGESLIDYIQKERIALAKELLSHREYSISDTAIRTGYTNFSHFSRQFRKFVGCTPNEFRKQQKEPNRRKGD